MKKLIALFIACTFILTACLQTETHTSINADGSGSMVATVDLSEMMQMMAGKKAQTENIKLDTVMYMRHHSDTASALTAYQKQLLREMKARVVMDMTSLEKIQFKITITAPFKTLEDFNALNQLMKQKEYDAIFDKAMDIPMFSDKNKEEQNSSGENDNIFASLFPAFYQCDYKKNSIVCKLDKAKYQEALESLKKTEFDLDGELENKMFSAASFSNKITLPRKPGKMEGTSLKKGAVDNELVQSGNLLDLYKHPEKYEYSVQY